ncbi:helix-turn-helix domain-containing protein [Desulfocurvibacter africanus]|uniref:helix-turn-helix domain-containing protein n=1 Tax=Desulfocurvibacter africanus TaxID=873 RepID=UPI0003FAC739|nr:helix-turn-helix transcriptional regulator [Desulfocurvibacter africanus]
MICAILGREAFPGECAEVKLGLDLDSRRVLCGSCGSEDTPAPMPEFFEEPQQTQEPVAVAIGRRLRALRESLGLSQYELADAMGVAQVTVSGWERGVLKLKDEHLQAVCSFGGVRPAWLLCLGDEQEKSESDIQPVESVQPKPLAEAVPELDVATLARAVREALPEAEACALGLEYLAGLCRSDVIQVEAMLASLGMTIFKAPVQFKDELQKALSVSKKLRAWAERESA